MSLRYNRAALLLLAALVGIWCFRKAIWASIGGSAR